MNLKDFGTKEKIGLLVRRMLPKKIRGKGDGAIYKGDFFSSERVCKLAEKRLKKTLKAIEEKGIDDGIHR